MHSAMEADRANRYIRAMIDWSRCPEVTRRPDTLSGESALLADPRISPDLVVENMDLGLTADDVAEIYGLRTPAAQLGAIYTYAKRVRGAAP